MQWHDNEFLMKPAAYACGSSKHAPKTVEGIVKTWDGTTRW